MKSRNHTTSFHRAWGKAALILLAAALLVACASPQPTSEPVPAENTQPPTDTLPPPTETSAPTQTATLTLPPPTETATLPPSQTPTPADTETSTPSATLTLAPSAGGIPLPAARFDMVNIYFVQLNSGNAACGDRILAVSSEAKISGNIAKDVAAGLRKLFSYHSKFYGELYNPLFASRLRVEGVEFDKQKGYLEVWLSGHYEPSGDDCDKVRVRTQVWGVIRQFPEVTSSTVHLNRILLGDLLE
jgi:hypothetical protein